MAELDRALVALGGEIEFPPTPDVARRAGRRIAAGERPGRPRRAVRALAIALAVFLLAVATALAVPSSRHVILEWFGLQGATVERVVSLPRPPSASETPATADLGLGAPVSLAEARRRAGFALRVPSRLGAPDEVFVEGSGADARVTLVYAAGERLPESSLTGVGLLLTEFRGDIAPELIGKLAGQATVVEEVTIRGEPGIWLEGAPHELFYRGPNGEIVPDSLRLAGNTLLWQDGSLLLRMESSLPKPEALAVARSAARRTTSG